ncbi:cytochrome P450 [Trichoderma longibrachiatum]
MRKNRSTMYSYILAISILAYWIVKRVVASTEERIVARKNACQPCARLPQRERVIGFSLFKQDAAAAREGKSLQTAQDRFRSLGDTFSGVILGQFFISTIDPENAKALLSSQFGHFDSGKKALFGPFLGHSMLTTDGAPWKHSRSLVRPHLGRNQAEDLSKLEDCVQSFFACLPKNGSTVDLQHLFFRLTFDNVIQLLLGETVSTLDCQPGSELHMVIEAFESIGDLVNRRATLGPLLRFYRDSEMTAACRILHDFVDRIVEKAFRKRNTSKGSTPPGSFLENILDSTDDLVKIRFEVLGLLLAGRDTTAGTLSSLFYILARRPDIWAKLQTEIKRLGGRKPTYNDIKGLKYLRQLIDETLRLYPPVPVLFRAANQTTILPRGGGVDSQSPVLVPKGTVISCSTFSLQRRQDVYGLDAEEFRPERWEILNAHWNFLPFSAGPKVCLGQTYAYAQMAYIVSRIVQHFERIEERSSEPWVEKWSIILMNASGTKVGMIPRTGTV